MDEQNFQADNEVNNETFYSASAQSAGVTGYTVYSPFVPYGYTEKTYKEKNGLRKIALTIGLSLIVMFLVSSFWSVVFFAVMTFFGYDRTEAYNFISQPAVMQVVQIVLSCLMFTVPFILIFKANGFRISDAVPLGKPKKGTALPLFFFGIAFCAFANIAVSSAAEFFSRFGIEYNVDFGDNPSGLFGFVLTFISTVITPALVEEFACRGLMLGTLKKYGEGFAVVVSAILFGIIHGNFEQIPFAFLVGLVLGFITVKSGTLWVSVAVHGFNNLISVLSDYFLSSLPVIQQNLIYSMFLAVCLLLGVAALLFGKSEKELFKFEKSDTESTVKQKSKWFFTHPAIIIFIVVLLIEACSFFVL